MRYIEFQQAGNPDVLALARGIVPEPKAHEVLIRVQAAGVNRPDVLQRQGKYPVPANANPVLGLEVAGIIEKIGEEVHTFKVGEKVCALTNGGGYAEFCSVPAGQVLPWPENFTAVEAAAIPETFFTVWSNVFQDGNFQSGESVLIHGGSSGIGTTAIQLVKAFGGTVFVTAGTDEKCAACIALGADAAFNYNTQDFVEELKAHTAGKGVNIILDSIGADYFDKNISTLALDGRLIIIGFLGGAMLNNFNLGRLMSRRVRVSSSALRPRSSQEKADIASALQRNVWPLLKKGICKPVVSATFPLEKAAQAHALMESSQHIGKIVLET